MLRRLAGNAADDLAQETFLAAWRSAASWRGEGSYFAWLARIAWRKFLSSRRLDRPTAPLDEAAHLTVQPSAPHRSAIDQAIGRLPDRERMAALLCFGQNCPHPEAAAIMGIPLGTLKSLVSRARTQLIHCLEDDQ